MRRAFGLILIAAGALLYFFPPTLPGQYSPLSAYVRWGGPVLAIFGILLLLPRRARPPMQRPAEKPT